LRGEKRGKIGGIMELAKFKELFQKTWRVTLSGNCESTVSEFSVLFL